MGLGKVDEGKNGGWEEKLLRRYPMSRPFANRRPAEEKTGEDSNDGKVDGWNGGVLECCNPRPSPLDPHPSTLHPHCWKGCPGASGEPGTGGSSRPKTESGGSSNGSTPCGWCKHISVMGLEPEPHNCSISRRRLLSMPTPSLLPYRSTSNCRFDVLGVEEALHFSTKALIEALGQQDGVWPGPAPSR
jgi:hypothetical protein